MSSKVTNVVVAGLGGQGVLRASDILAQAAFNSGTDVKKAEVHGMSQRGGSVSSDVRFGVSVKSPMVPEGTADYLILLDETQFEPNKNCLANDGTLIKPDALDIDKLPNKRSLNVALLGVLSVYLSEIDQANWIEAIRQYLPEKLRQVNEDAFALGRDAGKVAN